jgi:hypothetical protein
MRHKFIGDGMTDASQLPINWRRRKVLDYGGAAVVYLVAGVVAKVGQITVEEADAQRHFAQSGEALPVLSYVEEFPLPHVVTKECCGRHGLRKAILPEDAMDCTCGEPLAVLLMPLAAPLDEAAYCSPETQQFALHIADKCRTELGRCWDDRPANIARYNGRLVALDFGEEGEL